MSAPAPEATARRSAAAVSRVGAGFMSDPSLAQRGAELGYGGIDFYLAGRAGVLGEVGAAVATAALGFFAPGVVDPAWRRTASLLPRHAVAQEFAACAASWAEARLPLDADVVRLAELASALHRRAESAGAPIFAGWRALAVPDEPRQAVVHLCNGLREHRMACHLAALITARLDVADAVRFRSPDLVHHFGWSGELTDLASVRSRWAEAEACTDAVAGDLYATMPVGERAEFEHLVTGLVRRLG
ncbi:MAG: hypothetical protein U5L08_14725 [Xanthomonadales bacterium]|nr:hypothetical protein [Xanthomonadales bacterium]